MNKYKKILIISFVIICIIILLVVGYIFLKDYLECNSNNKDIDELIDEVFIDDSTQEENKIDWSYLKSINEDIIGWIEIEGTQINYPILKDNDNLYYLKHNYLKNYNSNGSIFTLDEKPFEDNETLLYGHNMKNGSMFSILGNYLNKEFLFLHQKIKIYTPNKNYECVIFSAYSIGIETEKNNISTLSFDERIEYYKNASNVNVDNVNTSNKIIKLSTCSYINSKTRPTEQRYYIVATLNEIN
jgi:sortase B